MTEAIKQWIADQGINQAKRIFPNGTDFDISVSSSHFISGLTKGIKIAEGFPDWANDNRYVWDHDKRKYIAAWDNYSESTTSQLLEKYLEYLKTLEP